MNTHSLIYATFDNDVAAQVVLNGVKVYWEDDDDRASHGYTSAHCVAKQLAKALDCKLYTRKLSSNTMPMEEDDRLWTHDDITRAALAPRRGRKRDEP